MKGTLITFEGGEGSGKSTQLPLTAQFLEAHGFEVVATREPGGTPLSERIRGLLMDTVDETVAPLTELLLFQAARAQHVAQVVLPALRRGAIVLCDRYVDSTHAYQITGRGLDADLVDRMNRLAAGEAWPTHTFLLDLPVEVGMGRATDRGSTDRMMQESMAFHSRIRDEFLRIAKEDTQRITIIDATLSVEQVQQQLQRHLRMLPFMLSHSRSSHEF
ncbi:MAG: dTMP kinase [Candidatus Hydrogenedentales bacterium]|jgi:dTMP kinase